MTVEVQALGVACNLSCPYCYQNPVRIATENRKADYDLDKIKASLLRQGANFTVFGGEPLLMPLEDLEDLFKFGYEHFKGNSIQTNGVLISDAHIDLFKRYQVGVGISMDGPGELNRSRWAGTEEKTDRATELSIQNIGKLIDNGVTPSLIITLYRGNAGTNAQLILLADWIADLDRMGVRHIRLHTLEVDDKWVGEHMTLTPERQIEVFKFMHDMERELQLSFDVFHDIRILQAGTGESVTCVWNQCDPYTTSAVQGIGPDGNLHNCGRTDKRGVHWVKADTASRERQLALYNTPQEHGGCKDCRFWFACGGQCPGTGLGGDWRNRSDGCELWKELFTIVERDMLAADKLPESLSAERQKRTEHEMNALHASASQSWHADSPHGDHHGDEHGDHHGDSDAATAWSMKVPVS